MKKFILIFVLLCVGGIAVLMSSLSKKNPEITYLRLHIRANSNDVIDQNVKYKVKDQIVEYLTPLFLNCTSKSMAEQILKNNLNNIEMVADKVLSQNNFSYKSNAKLNNEYFPTRAYDDLVLENGYYDALIIELGSGKGDNWWCVVYPPLCFADCTQKIEYKSKFLEIINKIF